MEYFFYTVETIPEGMGFGAYSMIHFLWLFALIAVCVVGSVFYRKASPAWRTRIRKGIAIALIVDEFYKLIPLLITGRWTPDYLPLHLCSVNIFLIAWHAWKGGKTLGGFLYTICIPGALAAMLFPTWAALPALNFMTTHSFTVHILLIAYPVLLTAGGDIRPNWRYTLKYMGILAVLAAIAFVINLLLDTNFFFLMEADPGNPLYWFAENWGSHLLGFPVIIAGVLLAMQGPLILLERRKLQRDGKK